MTPLSPADAALERVIAERRSRHQAPAARADDMADARLERDIDRAKFQFIHAKTPTERSQWLRTMEALIARRSPEQIRRMEKERGLG